MEKIQQKQEAGQGAVTQFSILKFINDKKPDERGINFFIKNNYTRLVPTGTYSRYEYIEILKEYGLLDISQNGTYYLLGKGYEELEHLKGLVNMSEALKESEISFDLPAN